MKARTNHAAIRRFRQVSFNPALFSQALLILLVILSPTLAQSPPSPSRGFHPAGSYAVGEVETINNINGNMTVNIPMASLPNGRGGSGAQVGLYYNSKLYDLRNNGTELHPYESPNGGWRYNFQYTLDLKYRWESNLNLPPFSCPAPNDRLQIWQLNVVFPDGSSHVMRAQGYHGLAPDEWDTIQPDGFIEGCGSGSWTNSTVNYFSIDGTCLRLEVYHDNEEGNWIDNPWTLYLPDGSRVTFNEAGVGNGIQRIYDSNNNYIEIRSTTKNGHMATEIRDPFNRSIVIEYDGPTDRIYETGVGGVELQWAIHWTKIWPSKKYYQGSDPSYTWAFDPQLEVVQKIDLPSLEGALSWEFTYNGSATDIYPTPTTGLGEISSIKAPSGAKTLYQYRHDDFHVFQAEDILRNSVFRKTQTYRLEYDGQFGETAPLRSEVWEYQSAFFGEVQIKSPDQGVVKEQVDISQLSWRTEYPDGRMTERIWQDNRPNVLINSGLRVNPYVKTEFTSIKNAGGGWSQTAIKDFIYDKNGNLKQVAEYDWVAYNLVPRDVIGKPTGIPAGALLKRVTVNTYYNPTPDAANTTEDNPNVYHKTTSKPFKRALASKEICADLSCVAQTPNLNAVVSRMEYDYESTDGQGLPTTENRDQHGNLTLERSWDSTKGAVTRPLSTSNSISVTHKYDNWVSGVTGRLIQTHDARKNANDPNGSITVYVYGDIDGLNHTNLYPTQIRVADNVASIKRTTNLKYDFSSGLPTESTDADNIITTRTTYDVFGRPTLVEEAFGTPSVRKTVTLYSDTNRRVIVRKDQDNAGDGKLVTIQHYDQLGRVRLTRQLESFSTDRHEETEEIYGIKVQTRYFAGDVNANPPILNSYDLVSAPYRANYSSNAGNEPGMGWKRMKYAQGGRLIEAETFAGGTPTLLPVPWGNNASSTGKIQTSYDAETVLVKDQANKSRKSGIDGLGRLVKVWEDPTPGGANYETSYTYNALDSLTIVTQATQTRSFSYSSLKRLTSATNPESGMMSYTYDANGNLLTKTDARKWVTKYTYDALNRNTMVDYSNTSISPDTTRIYDNPANGKGLLWKEYGNGNEEQGANVEYREIGGYDKLGRPLSVSQKAKFNNSWTALYTTAQTYNSAGQVKMMTYPTGRTVNYEYDAAGRLNEFRGTLGGTSTLFYATGLQYNARGQLRREQFGTNTLLYHRMYYNARGQMTDARLGADGSTSFDVETPQTTAAWWGSWDRGALRWEYGSANLNNGNVTRQEHLLPQSSPNLYYTAQLYNYDALNRLTSVTEKTGTQGDGGKSDGAALYTQAFAYDRWGNRTIDQANSTPQTQVPWLNLKTYQVQAATNRLTAAVAGDADGDAKDLADQMKYDEAGNLIFDTWSDATNGGKRTYDAENRLVKAVGVSNQSQSYAYDAGGRRVRRVLNNGTETWWQVYGVGGELVAEYKLVNGTPMLQKEYGYRNGQLLVVYDAAETGDKQWQWLVTDALGTARMVVDRSGTLAGVRRHDYLPFGEELLAASCPLRTAGNGYPMVTDKVRQKFTSKERDAETGLDYFLARYYSNVQGRFTSPDEFTGGPDELYDFASVASDNPTFYADLTDPQSLNKYQYCYNNPLAYTDPDGHKGLREWAKQAVAVAADFTVGVSQGVVASISYGVCSLCQASANDSISRRAGQVLGTAIVGGQGTSMIGAGGGALVLTGGTLVPAYATVAVGTALAAGAAKNGLVLASTPMQMASSSGAPKHHIMTNKNSTSAASGGPWTPKFEALAKKAGMELKDPLNIVPIKGHKGPHPEAYHQAVYDRLVQATKGLRGKKYESAFKAELQKIGVEAQTPGTILNKLVTQ